MYTNSARFLAVVALFSSLTACAEGWSGVDSTQVKQAEIKRPELKAYATAVGTIKAVSADEGGNVALIGMSGDDLFIDRINSHGNSMLSWPQKIVFENRTSVNPITIKNNGSYIATMHKQLPANSFHVNVFLGSNATSTMPQLNFVSPTEVGDIAIDQDSLFLSMLDTAEPGTSILYRSGLYGSSPIQVKVPLEIKFLETGTDGLYLCSSNTVGKIDKKFSGNLLWNQVWSGTGPATITSTAFSDVALYAAGIENEHPRLASYSTTGKLNWAMTFQIMKTDQPVFVAVDSGGTPYLAFNGNMYKMNRDNGMITDSFVIPNTKFTIHGRTAVFFQKDKLSELDLTLLN